MGPNKKKRRRKPNVRKPAYLDGKDLTQKELRSRLTADQKQAIRWAAALLTDGPTEAHRGVAQLICNVFGFGYAPHGQEDSLGLEEHMKDAREAQLDQEVAEAKQLVKPDGTPLRRAESEEKLVVTDAAE